MPRLDGFDGYHGQKEHGTDLTATRAAGLWWIGWKATQSTTYVDPTFAEIRQAWLDFEQRCPYHWLSSITDPTEQADHYLDTVGELVAGEGAMLDAEEMGISVAKCLAWFEYVEDHTHRPSICYSGIYVKDADTGIAGGIWNSPELRMSKYGPRLFIVAAYVTEANLRARMASLGSKAFDGWQYSSDGPVPGVVGRCDMDQIDNRLAFDLACGVSAIPHPDSGPDPIPPEATDMALNYYVTDGANAKFIGVPARLWWTGPGDAKIETAIAHQLAAGNLIQVALSGVDKFSDSFLEGPLPTGDALHVWTGDEFCNTVEIKTRPAGVTVDQVARDAIGHVSADLAAVDAAVDKIKAVFAAAGI